MSRCDCCVRTCLCVCLIRGRSSRRKKGKNHFCEIGVSQSRFFWLAFSRFVSSFRGSRFCCTLSFVHFILFHFISSFLLSVRICLQVTNYNRTNTHIVSLLFRFLISFEMKNDLPMRKLDSVS